MKRELKKQHADATYETDHSAGLSISTRVSLQEKLIVFKASSTITENWHHSDDEATGPVSIVEESCSQLIGVLPGKIIDRDWECLAKLPSKESCSGPRLRMLTMQTELSRKSTRRITP